METWRHRAQMNLLVDSLDDNWRPQRSDYYVAGDMALYFSETQALNNDFRAPDVFVVLDTEHHERKRWVVWEEDGRTPDVVIELVSESTEHVDRGRKMTIYAGLRVAVYVIYDPFSARLDAYYLAPNRKYVRIEPDERGYVWCEPLDLFLGVVPGIYKFVEARWLRWIDRDGRPFIEDRERALMEAERAAKESDRADRAEAELARLREELERRG